MLLIPLQPVSWKHDNRGKQIGRQPRIAAPVAPASPPPPVCPPDFARPPHQSQPLLLSNYPPPSRRPDFSQKAGSQVRGGSVDGGDHRGGRRNWQDFHNHKDPRGADCNGKKTTAAAADALFQLQNQPQPQSTTFALPPSPPPTRLPPPSLPSGVPLVPPAFPVFANPNPVPNSPTASSLHSSLSPSILLPPPEAVPIPQLVMR